MLPLSTLFFTNSQACGKRFHRLVERNKTNFSDILLLVAFSLWGRGAFPFSVSNTSCVYFPGITYIEFNGNIMKLHSLNFKSIFSVMRRYRTNVSYSVTQSLSHSVTLRTELTDVTLVSEDAY